MESGDFRLRFIKQLCTCQPSVHDELWSLKLAANILMNLISHFNTEHYEYISLMNVNELKLSLNPTFVTVISVLIPQILIYAQGLIQSIPLLIITAELHDKHYYTYTHELFP